ncbi:amino acid/amide ABC transporter membrane protein 1, HAAT family /amino acid/amide ABC transporter membrane protein 2, HAAT family /amino acid/amide ABC transporter ATP-binding protein 1, HAAT family [Pseudonocardia thermophila]|jgi:ABC-type branched-chain amino acid transport systems, ATPase component|uniref:Amino acid/amide ABC transporter membrane protein 1, HAAT family /amino acid/amide ABC transporter membrane protein 2, HAAT family /amino acid/amide ABC transporter ATP-binding protein 1, HAAT family n=1 Tax=Pseudonocardia thermophila TaxID=1848 RepID=A0A1M6P445_PSETH|nr:branched-chain amino acid ABC transporter permease/ATP-binding protein [Pseudonocardia thermophila]SHK02698.1 amino acid/amide ABC transporter membrane protein 1, HAAT family /amino acid/amide ABC transporter membrane protein 2, HAAT family /amino acid/amide ABC transporter ATP-binding protein 1, HAAT family [Pseudonocardia thermophila]
MDLLQFALLGLGVGAAYVLMGQGIVLIHRGSGLLNFAQGGIALVAAQTFKLVRDDWGVPAPLALAAALAVAAAIGAAMQLLVLDRLRERSALVKLIATLGLLTLIEGVGVVLWGDSAVPMVGILPTDPVPLGGGIVVGADRLCLLAIGVALTAALWFVHGRTRFGTATSAVAENPAALAALGHSPARIATLNWVLGAVLAGLAGVLLAPITGLSVTALVLSVIPGLAAALVGRFSSYWWTLVGGLGIGVLQSEIVRFWDVPGLSQSVPFLVIIAMVVLRGRVLPARGEVSARAVRVGTGALRPAALVGVVIAGGLVLAGASGDWRLALTNSALTGILALSVVLVTGYAGQVSLAQLTIGGVGALAAANGSARLGLPFPLAVLFGTAVAVVVGLVVALPALRTRGLQLAVVTIGLGLAIEALVLRNPGLGGGFTGLTVGEPDVLGFSFDYLAHPVRYAALAGVAFLLAALALANLRRGPTGRRLLAVRASERAAACSGVGVLGAKLYAFGLGAAFGGFAGALAAFQFPRLDVADYTTLGSVTLLIQAMIGGIGYVGGAIVAGLAGAGGVVAELLSRVGESWTDAVILISGVVVLVNLVFYPDGVARTFAEVAGHALDEVRFLRPRRAGAERPPTAHPAARAERPTLRVEDLTVRFGGVVAVRGVSLQVRPGEVVGLIGPNGAGKTTIIDAVCGLVPSTGRISLGDTSLAGLSPRQRTRAGIGRTFQSLELFDDLSVLDNVRVAAESRDRRCYLLDLVRPRAIALPEVARTALTELDLTGVLDVAPEHLPAGQRGLVGVARTLATDPSIVLLDEPASGLDDEARAEIVRLIRHLAEQRGLGVLLVEHDVRLVAEASDRIVALALGEVICEGSPAEVLSHPRVVEVYLGSDSPVQPAVVGGAE